MIIKGLVYVVRDNIDTDQIIPAMHLVYSTKDAEERKKYGQYAMSGLPRDKYPNPFVSDGEWQSKYSIIIAGKNFGCGSSREQAASCLQIAGIKVVLAQSFARIFYRNSISGAFLTPLEYVGEILKNFETGDEIEIDIENLRIKKNDKEFDINPLGDAAGIIEAGGIFKYARKMGWINN